MLNKNHRRWIQWRIGPMLKEKVCSLFLIQGAVVLIGTSGNVWLGQMQLTECKLKMRGRLLVPFLSKKLCWLIIDHSKQTFGKFATNTNLVLSRPPMIPRSASTSRQCLNTRARQTFPLFTTFSFDDFIPIFTAKTWGLSIAKKRSWHLSYTHTNKKTSLCLIHTFTPSNQAKLKWRKITFSTLTGRLCWLNQQNLNLRQNQWAKLDEWSGFDSMDTAYFSNLHKSVGAWDGFNYSSMRPF